VIYGMFVEPNLVEIRHLWIDNVGLGEALQGKIAVHLSDIHVSKIGKREKKILKIIEDSEPDFIFLTGDYVKWDGDYEVALTFLSRLKAKSGIWAVMGDYDYSCSRRSCLFCHENGTGDATQRHRVQFLRNSMQQLKFPEGHVWIKGIDEEAERPFSSRAKFSPAGKNGPNIILCHNPLTFDDLDKNQDVLMLAGDTHGGQIPLPSWLWRILGYEKNARYNQGFFQEGRKKMYVSRGIGISHLPIRMFRRPEVVVLHF
jgi:predicted MPP superfamily phosphohydrolase